MSFCRRNARPRDHRIGAKDARRAIDVRDSAHELGRFDYQSHHRCLPVNAAGASARQLSLTLEGILCQTLLRRDGRGRALAMEILIPNSGDQKILFVKKGPPDLCDDADCQDVHGMRPSISHWRLCSISA